MKRIDRPAIPCTLVILLALMGCRSGPLPSSAQASAASQKLVPHAGYGMVWDNRYDGNTAIRQVPNGSQCMDSVPRETTLRYGQEWGGRVDTSNEGECFFKRSIFYMKFIDESTGGYLDIQFEKKGGGQAWGANFSARHNTGIHFCNFHREGKGSYGPWRGYLAHACG